MTVRDRRAVVWSVVVAAGSGERFGGDKQAADLAGQPAVSYTHLTLPTILLV